MNTKVIRELAIVLLNDEHGINAEAWDRWNQILTTIGATDIIASVQHEKGRYFLGEDDAEDLLAV